MEDREKVTKSEICPRSFRRSISSKEVTRSALLSFPFLAAPRLLTALCSPREVTEETGSAARLPEFESQLHQPYDLGEVTQPL